ncbi:MAG TPA: thermonuclease family protein [Chryseolinea sp.]|nr:thermonuclease family protein [Chryseolinea sp.]
MKTKMLGTITGILLMGSVWANDGVSGKVVSVIDGNTIEVIGDDNETIKISLLGIDCPELGQDYGDKAKKFMEKLTLEKNVTVKLQGKDRWGNYLAIVTVNDKIDPRVELLKEGLAWTAEKNPLPELEEHKEKAKEKNKGLWKQENPTPPWIYRREQTMLQPKSS